MKQITLKLTQEGYRDAMRRAYQLVSDALQAGGSLIITIARETKSRAQEEKYHAMIGDIAKTVVLNGKAFGAEVWKALLVDSFEQEMRTMDSPISHPSKVIISLDGERAITVRASTTKFRKHEGSQFIEYLYAFGVENGAVFSEKSLSYYHEYKEATA